MRERWIDEAWAAAAPTFDSIVGHPFVRELAAGTLAEERFRFYLQQDGIYLKSYAETLALVAARMRDGRHSAAFARFVSEGIAAERLLHDTFLGNEGLQDCEPAPATLQYTGFLAGQGGEPGEVAAAMFLPCFWLYNRVGEWIHSHHDAATNRYARWIATYADGDFAASAREAVEICDQLAEDAGEAVRRRMTEAFVRGAEMELRLWDSAWNIGKNITE